MRFLKPIVLATLSAFALTSVHAATLSPAPVKSGSALELIKKKAKGKKSSKSHKCGENKYFSKKAKKCLDARDKK